MGACNRYGSLMDAELHRFGLCLCAIYTPPPPRLPWERADIERLLGLMGFTLVEQADGTFYAHDPSREVYSLHNPRYGLPYERLDNLVITTACANSLAGPMTADEARAKLARLGITLRGSMHKTWGWVWVAHHAASDHAIDGAFNLTHLVEMATGYVRRLGSYQPVIEAITANMPRPRLRPEQLRAAPRPRIDTAFARRARPRRRERAAPADAGEQLTLDVFAGGAAPPAEPASEGAEG